MTTFLFCVVPEKGHVNPMIGPAQALVEAGHEVAFWAGADIGAELAAAGISRFVGPRDVPRTTPHRGEDFAAHVRDPTWLRQWVKSLLVDAAERDIAPIRAAIDEVRPDVVAIDPLMYAAAIASSLAGVPWASISNSLNPVLPATLESDLLRTVAWLDADRRALFARHGLESPAFRGCDVLSPLLTVAFATEAFVDPSPGVALVGPSLPRARRGDETELPALDDRRPLVYASFGSQVFHQPAMFRALIDAVRDRPVTLVLSTGDLDLGPLPTNVVACPYVSQLAVLARARVLVTHGGANSVMEALAAGVPMLVTPICNDQHHQAHFVGTRGVGRVIAPESLDASSAWTAIAALLGDGPERRAVAIVAESYRRDGAAETARRLSALAAGNRPGRAS